MADYKQPTLPLFSVACVNCDHISHSVKIVDVFFSGPSSNNFKMQFVVMIRSLLKNAQTLDVSSSFDC